MESRVQVICLVVLTTVAVGAALDWLQPVLIPFVLAVFVALTLSPLVDLQARYLRLPRPLALLATLVLVVFLFISVAMLVSASVNELARHAGDYEKQVVLMVQRVWGWLPPELTARVPQSELQSLTRISAGTVGSALAQTTNAILAILSQGFIVFVFVLFLMVGGGQWSRQQAGVMGEAIGRVRRYLIVNLMISAATGTLVGGTLYLLGIPLATVFGLLAFLLNFIPTVGSIIATLLPLPVVIISPDVSLTAGVLAIVLPGSIQLIVGNLIAPKVLGDSLDLHPVVILMALIFWGMIWGIVGMLLATPMTAVLKILLQRVPSTEPIAELMAGRIGALEDAPRGASAG